MGGGGGSWLYLGFERRKGAGKRGWECAAYGDPGTEGGGGRIQTPRLAVQ